MKTESETNHTTAYDIKIVATTTNWVLVEKTFLVPANIKKLNILLVNMSTGILWFDDARIRKTSDAIPQERALNITYNTFKSPFEITETGVDKISFTYNQLGNRSSMFYGGLQTDKMQRQYRKHYSADGTMEIKHNTATGTVEFVTYIGGDGYTAPVVVKSNGTTQEYLYLHRDYLSSIVAITNQAGTVVEKRLFDAWGEVIKVVDGQGALLSAFAVLDRGYTGHEHLQSVALIHMNGRLYDAKLHRFLQPDNYVQDPTNTQNFNRYGYVLNNPLAYTDSSGEWIEWVAAAVVAAFTYLKAAHDNKDQNGNWQWNPFKWNDVPTIGIGTTGNFQNGFLNVTAMPTVTPTGTSTPLAVGPQVNWHVNLGASNGPVVEPISDVIGGGQNGGLLKYDWWLFEDQYFSADASSRHGTYIDFSPFKKLLGITLGEYTESSIKADYYDYNNNISRTYNKHYFEAGIAVIIGVDFKYNLGEKRFDSLSLSMYGLTLEWSKQSSYQRQFFVGLDTGINVGIGIGGGANIKGGWRWDY